MTKPSAATSQLPPQDWLRSPASRQVAAAIAAAGGEMRFVGGCVRDALLHRPVFDIDAACTLPPERMMHALQQAGLRVIPTGLAHGTVTALCEGQGYEITTLRRDTACDGRHAAVDFTDDWREDAARRDFTMNALYATIDGQLYDYFGGEADARAGRVRFIGDARARIREDGLRILRFFRFFAHYGQGTADADALAACHAERAMLEGLSGERIHSELFKLLSAPQPLHAISAMRETGILPALHLPAPEDEQTLARIATACPHPLLRLAVWMRLAPAQLEPLLQRWRCTNHEKSRLRALVQADTAAVAHWDDATCQRILRRKGREYFVDMHWLAQAEHPQYHAQYQQRHDWAQKWEIPVFPLNGHDLMALGIPHGKTVGALLQQLETWWEEQGYTPDKTALLAEARRRQNL